ncbi:23766_t:CDS:2, partial [Racocetra persica]
AAEEVDQKLLLNQKAFQQAVGVVKSQDDGLEESELSSSSDEEDDGRGYLGSAVEGEGSDDEQADTDEIEEVDDDTELVVHTNRQDKISLEEDEEFEREFSRMMTESMESRKYERKPAMLDVAIPMHPKSIDKAADHIDGSVSFTLLVKKGNKQQTKTIEVPAESALAVNTRSKQEAE